MDITSPDNPIATGNGKLNFKLFPGFAKFIREHHLIPYIQEQLRLSRELDLPIMKHIMHIPDDQLIQMGLQSHTEFLKAAENNKLSELIEKTLKTWEDDQLGILGRDDIATDDITVGAHVRKRSLLKLLPLYTTDPNDIIELVNEIDAYSVTTVSRGTNTYIKILKERINDHAHFIERITNTSPGAIYVFDLVEKKEVYSNEKLADMLGYTTEDMKAMGSSLLSIMIHPEDVDIVLKSQEEIISKKDGEITTLLFRSKCKDGRYVWVRTHRAVFKRDKNGIPTHVIGIMLNVDKEQHSDEELRLKHEQLLEAQALASMGSFEWDTEADTIEATPEFYKIFATDTNYANNILPGVHPADMSRVKAARKKAVDEAGLYDIEYRFLAGDKEKIIWTRGAVYFKNGRKMMRGTVMDITERKHIIQSLQRSEELYKQAQAMSHIGNWAWDLKANKFSWSDELYRIYGLQPGTMITSELLRYMNHPEDNKMIQDTIAASLVSHEPYDFYYKIILSTGTERIVHANGNVWVDDEGQAYKMTGTVQDVTERQKLIESLQTSEVRYKQAQAMAHIGNWEWYIADNRIEWTDELYRIYGLDPEQGPITYEAYTALLHPDERELIMSKVQRCKDEHEPYDINHRIVLKTGEVKYLRGMGDVLLDKDGKAVKMFGTAQDITAQKESEMAMQQKNIELSYSNTSLEEFAYVASHDLKEPLRKISTFGDLLLNKDRDSLSDTGKSYLDKIISSSKRMQTMINDLMSVSTITGNKSFEPYDLNEILDEVLGVLEFNIREKGAAITHNELPTVQIVPSQFRHLFQNLLSNSLKFAKPDVAPVIDINASYITAAEASSFGLTERRKYLKLRFTDNGIGFENEYSNKIFTIFQRLHGKSDYEGNGIGLSICRKVAENHKGIIYANSTLGEGAVFTVIIPA